MAGLAQRQVAILGSTGSIGTAALAVMAHLGEGYRVAALSTHSRVDLLCEQVERFRPGVAIVTGPEPTAAQHARLVRGGTRLMLGKAALNEAAAEEGTDTVLAAIVGAAGLPSTFAAVKAGKRVALANKESLVVAGALLMPLAEKTGAVLLPVDSEHSAIFQAAQAGRRSEVRRVILTASGGPFRSTPLEEVANATAKEALAHPTWQMGAKITVDSATMFNKGFEMLEAIHLFGLSPEQVEIVIHPQSIVHSMVEFVDGSTVAQLSPPDMKLPIQYALTYPERRGGCCPVMDWRKAHTLTFSPPEDARYPAIALAYEAARTGGSLPAVMNAANEVAVEAFLAGQIRFGEIARMVRECMDGVASEGNAGLTMGSLAAADANARADAAARLAGR